MHKRATQREIPNTDRIVGFQIGSQGDMCFRIAGPLVRSAWAVLDRTDPAMMGILIGLSWFDLYSDLDVAKPGHTATADEWRAYGFAVIDELDQADWYPAEVDGVAALLLSEWSERMMVHGEARERVDFFAVTRGSLRTSRQTSNSDTLAADPSTP
jgi:hypothetical protein